MLLAVHHRVMEHLGSLESTQEARIALGYASGNSYASFVLSKLPACSITRWCTLKHEPIVNWKNFSHRLNLLNTEAMFEMRPLANYSSICIFIENDGKCKNKILFCCGDDSVLCFAHAWVQKENTSFILLNCSIHWKQIGIKKSWKQENKFTVSL